MTIKVNQKGEINLKDLQFYVDISKAKFYSFREKEGTVVLKLYDKNRRLIKPYAKKES
jgi:hypothetical protein